MNNVCADSGFLIALYDATDYPVHYRALSLVDRVVRLMLSDFNLKIDFFITFNAGDFHDLCTRAKIVMIPQVHSSEPAHLGGTGAGEYECPLKSARKTY
jgi:hypothetical protein